MTYDIEEYADSDGRKPFQDWLLGLKDVVAKAKLTARIDRAAHGNFGDWKAMKNAPGVFEMREHYGPGYRIFYAVIGRKIVLLLAGSAKRDRYYSATLIIGGKMGDLSNADWIPSRIFRSFLRSVET